MVCYDGSHSISFINQDWNVYSDFTHDFERAYEQKIPKMKYVGHIHRDGKPHDDRNTWEDWGLVPSSPPSVAPAKQKRNSVEIPGTSGNTDLSYILAPWPTFQNRTGNWDFYIADRSIPLPVLEQKIGSFLHGRDVRVVLQDDPAYYYEGICEIGSINRSNDGSYSTISISYDLQPYKKCIYSSIDEWEWNPFNFNTDYISKKIFGDMSLVGGSSDPTKYYLDISANNELKAYNADGTKRTENDPLYRPTYDDFNKNNIIKLSSEEVYPSLTGSMPVVPKIKIKFSGPVVSESTENGHSYFFVAIAYRNAAIRDTTYITYKKYSLDEVKDAIKNDTYFEIVDPEIIFYDPYKRRTYEIAFYTNVITRANCRISIEFTKGEIL